MKIFLVVVFFFSVAVSAAAQELRLEPRFSFDAIDNFDARADFCSTVIVFVVERPKAYPEGFYPALVSPCLNWIDKGKLWPLIVSKIEMLSEK